MPTGKIKVLTACGIKHEQYLDSCRDSVKMLGKGVEHIVKFGDSPKHVLMNQALKEVNDEDIVIFLDADDYLNWGVEDSVEALEKYDLVYRDVENRDQHGEIKTYVSQPFDYDTFKKKNFIPFSGVMAKGWLVTKEDYPDNFPTEDWTYWHKLYKHSQRFGYVEGAFVTRRTWTSHVLRGIPIYSKIRRILRNRKARKINSQYYVE